MLFRQSSRSKGIMLFGLIFDKKLSQTVESCNVIQVREMHKAIT